MQDDATRRLAAILIAAAFRQFVSAVCWAAAVIAAAGPGFAGETSAGAREPVARADLVLWLDAQDLTDSQQDGESVGAWIDKSGLQHHARQYVDGRCVARNDGFAPETFDLDNDQPLRIVFGEHDYFNGKIKDLRIHSRRISPCPAGPSVRRRGHLSPARRDHP